MSLHGSDNRHWVSPHGKVAGKGVKSFQLGLKQIGLFKANSVDALADASGLSKREILVLRQGENGVTGRSTSAKNTSTVPFRLNTVQKVTVGMPKVAEQKTDYLRVGWDGIHDNTSFEFFKGDSWDLNMVFQGAPLSMFNSTGEYKLNLNLTTEGYDYGMCSEQGDLCEPIGCVDKTLEMVNMIKNHELPTGQKISEYFHVNPIFSTPTAATTVEYTKYCLDYCGFGDFNELANVSAQYPGLKVQRDTLTDKFVVMVPTSEGAPADYNITMESILKGCKDCPEGYDAIEGGFVYAVQLEDDGEDQTAVVQALPGAVASSAEKTGQEFGVGYYIVATDDKLTEAEIETFVNGDGELQAGNPTAVVMFVGETQDMCKNDTVQTASWTACGTCEVSEGKYRIMVADDCGGSRLAELSSRYPDLEITAVDTPAAANCVGLYETTVVSDFSCGEGCNPDIVQQVFNTEAPEAFDVNSYWYPVTEEADATGVSCGFEIKAKPFIVNPGEYGMDDIPFMATSMRITSVSGGYPLDYGLIERKRKLVNVLVLERAQDMDNLGGNLRDFEKLGNFYFRHATSGDANERFFKDNRTYLDGLTQYVDVTLTVHELLPHSMNVATPKAMTYHVLLPLGKHEDVANLFKSIASEAGADIEYI